MPSPTIQPPYPTTNSTRVICPEHPASNILNWSTSSVTCSSNKASKTPYPQKFRALPMPLASTSKSTVPYYSCNKHTSFTAQAHEMAKRGQSQYGSAIRQTSRQPAHLPACLVRSFPPVGYRFTGPSSRYCWKKGFSDDVPLGSGFTSVVYRGLDTVSGDSIAIKLVQKKKQRTLTSENYYRRLYQRLLVDTHPSLIRFRDFLEDSEFYYIITDLCQGPDLVSYILEFGDDHVSPDKARSIAYQTLLGLQHLHKRRIIHRDIKLDNVIFLDSTLNKIVILDFDMALMLDYHKNPSGKNSLRKLTIAGTHDYMAPEAHSGEYSEGSDLWSLGVMLYILLDGRFPYPVTNGMNVNEVLRLLQRLEIRESTRKRCPLGVDLVTRLLTYDVNRRLNRTDLALQHPWFYTKDTREAANSSLAPSYHPTQMRNHPIPVDKIMNNNSTCTTIESLSMRKMKGPVPEFKTPHIYNDRQDNNTGLLQSYQPSRNQVDPSTFKYTPKQTNSLANSQQQAQNSANPAHMTALGESSKRFVKPLQPTSLPPNCAPVASLAGPKRLDQSNTTTSNTTRMYHRTAEELTEEKGDSGQVTSFPSRSSNKSPELISEVNLEAKGSRFGEKSSKRGISVESGAKNAQVDASALHKLLIPPMHNSRGKTSTETKFGSGSLLSRPKSTSHAPFLPIISSHDLSNKSGPENLPTSITKRDSASEPKPSPRYRPRKKEESEETDKQPWNTQPSQPRTSSQGRSHLAQQRSTLPKQSLKSQPNKSEEVVISEVMQRFKHPSPNTSVFTPPIEAATIEKNHGPIREYRRSDLGAIVRSPRESTRANQQTPTKSIDDILDIMASQSLAKLDRIVSSRGKALPPLMKPAQRNPDLLYNHFTKNSASNAPKTSYVNSPRSKPPNQEFISGHSQAAEEKLSAPQTDGQSNVAQSSVDNSKKKSKKHGDVKNIQNQHLMLPAHTILSSTSTTRSQSSNASNTNESYMDLTDQMTKFVFVNINDKGVSPRSFNAMSNCLKPNLLNLIAPNTVASHKHNTDKEKKQDVLPAMIPPKDKEPSIQKIEIRRVAHSLPPTARKQTHSKDLALNSKQSTPAQPLVPRDRKSVCYTSQDRHLNVQLRPLKPTGLLIPRLKIPMTINSNATGHSSTSLTPRSAPTTSMIHTKNLNNGTEGRNSYTQPDTPKESTVQSEDKKDANGATVSSVQSKSNIVPSIRNFAMALNNNQNKDASFFCPNYTPIAGQNPLFSSWMTTAAAPALTRRFSKKNFLSSHGLNLLGTK